MTSGAWSHPAFAKMARLVATRTGLALAPHRRTDAEASIRRAMARAKVPDVSHYLALIETDAVPLDDLIVELTVGETYFFREPAHFAFIRDEVFPEALRRHGPDHVLRCWSAGCATGEEAYSLAIVLEEAGLSGHVLATDISRDALRKAREATYRRWALRGVDEARIRRLFHHADNRWTLDTRIGRHVTFEFHNLAQSAYPSVPAGLWGMDLILCRNVLIYFDKQSINRVAQGLYDSLAEDGWLITGPSDPPLDDTAPFATVVTTSGVFYRKSNLARQPSVPAHGESAFKVDQGRLALAATDHAARSSELLFGDSAPHEVQTERAADALEAFAAGDYDRVLELTHDAENDTTAALHVRALANCRGSELAARDAHRWVQRYPFSTELHVLHAVLLIETRRDDEATEALRRVLYLDRTLVIANFLLASVLRRKGKINEAWRAYRNARDLASARPPDEQLPFADGERAGSIVEIAEAEMALLGSLSS